MCFLIHYLRNQVQCTGPAGRRSGNNKRLAPPSVTPAPATTTPEVHVLQEKKRRAGPSARIAWRASFAPELTPAGTPAHVARLPIAGIDTMRYSVLIVRDGEHLSPRMAAAISAVRSVSAELRDQGRGG